MEEHVSLSEIGRRVRTAIAAFVIPAPHPDRLGTPLPAESFMQQLGEMRAALVEPYVLEIDGEGRSPGTSPKGVSRRIVIVAEDDSIFLAYDPDPEGDFALIFKAALRFGVSPVRGEAVDCFIAR